MTKESQPELFEQLRLEMNKEIAKVNEGACCGQPAQRVKAEYKGRLLMSLLRQSEVVLRNVSQHNGCHNLESINKILRQIESLPSWDKEDLTDFV